MGGFLERKCNLQSRINGFAFQSKDAEDAFMHAAQWFFAHEPFQRLNPERKFPQRQ